MWATVYRYSNKPTWTHTSTRPLLPTPPNSPSTTNRLLRTCNHMCNHHRDSITHLLFKLTVHKYCWHCTSTSTRFMTALTIHRPAEHPGYWQTILHLMSGVQGQNSVLVCASGSVVVNGANVVGYACVEHFQSFFSKKYQWKTLRGTSNNWHTTTTTTPTSQKTKLSTPY